LAEGDSIDSAGLPGIEGIPARGNIWLDQPNETLRGFDSEQHCRRRREAQHWEYTHFLGIARGSHFELQTQLTIARELGYADAKQISTAEDLSEEVGKMIFATIRSLQEGQP
jgi:hypothetical protein